jgi:hypothetical protein
MRRPVPMPEPYRDATSRHDVALPQRRPVGDQGFVKLPESLHDDPVSGGKRY